MKQIIRLYRNAFSGLSRPAWMLAVVMLINRSGTMVLPFLSIYLTSGLGYSLEQSGIILSCFGIGSMTGSFLGGWLTDKFGNFSIQFLSLILGGFLFVVLAFVEGFVQLAVGVLVLSTVAESFRPANAASVSLYARPENVSRAFSLNRMAINLGFSVGPALGGLLAAISYRWLFIADGFTCIVAGLFFFFYFRRLKGRQSASDPVVEEAVVNVAWKDRRFLVFVLLSTCFAILFFQLFITLPIYYRDVYHLSEGRIGLLLALNGLVVFSAEMILVYILGNSYKIQHLILAGFIVMGLSFLVLNLMHATSILFISMMMLSLAEILAMPFMVTFVVHRSSLRNRGAYMGLYSFSFALGHVISPIMGTTIIENLGYEFLWWFSAVASCMVGLGFYFVARN